MCQEDRFSPHCIVVRDEARLSGTPRVKVGPRQKCRDAGEQTRIRICRSAADGRCVRILSYRGHRSRDPVTSRPAVCIGIATASARASRTPWFFKPYELRSEEETTRSCGRIVYRSRGVPAATSSRSHSKNSTLPTNSCTDNADNVFRRSSQPFPQPGGVIGDDDDAQLRLFHSTTEYENGPYAFSYTC